MPAHSLKLDDNWDITLNGIGRIEVTTGAYAIAQEVATKVRAFYHDMFFNWEQGIPHFVDELGVAPNFTLIRSRIRERALEVDGVEDVEIELDESSVTNRNRALTGDIKLTLTDGTTVEIEI